MDGNRMTGRLPSWLGSLPNLSRLELNNNSLFGEFPLKLCQLPTLISQNNQVDFMFDVFELPVFVFRGNINTYLRFKDDYYHRIALSYNAFSGNVPEEIGNLQNLQDLELNNNHFSGGIPISVSKLKNLEILNLSTNNLTGEIPTSLASLSFLSHFDVSYNHLNGPIPTGGQLGTFQESSFEGNPNLCGEPLSRHSCLSPTISTAIDGDESHHNRRQFLDGLLAGFASGFSSIILIVGASYVWFNKRKRQWPSTHQDIWPVEDS